jgi:two-component system response regulator YesN
MENQHITDQVVRFVMTLPDEMLAGLTVSKLAYHFEIDRSKLSREFKKQKKMTLDKFLTKEKMFRAAFMLVTDENATIKEVSQRLGFCTCDYFIRVFRDYFGTVPGRYKELKTGQSGNGGSNGCD